MDGDRGGDAVMRRHIIEWAREQATEKRLKPLEAHLLLILATYCDDTGTASPSVAQLAEGAGLSVKHRRRCDRSAPRNTNESNAVSRALAALREKGLITREHRARDTSLTTLQVSR